jgi:predicted O-methyltransferase YrrM
VPPVGSWQERLTDLRKLSPILLRSSAEAQRRSDKEALESLRADNLDMSARLHPLEHDRREAERIGAAPFLDWMPPGHFYSPVPAMSELEQRDRELFSPPWPESVPGVDMNHVGQLEFVEKLKRYHDEYEFPTAKSPDRRYFSKNGSYEVADSLVLHGMIREFQPRRIIEVGSGHSSCMMLDTIEAHVGHDVQLTLIEPYPELVQSLLEPTDLDRVEIIDQGVQQVPIERFLALDADDILFIDSSHVVKTGSDVISELLEILPRLAPGVVIHLHDIFYPFEYGRPLVQQGRAWSEAYLLRGFLAFNHDFEVLFFNDYLRKRAQDQLEAHLPRMLPDAGGAIWLRRCP